MGALKKAFIDATSGVVVGDAVSPGWGASGREIAVGSEFTLSAALTTADGFVPLLALPAGARLTALEIHLPDLDTNVSPAIVLDVGTEDAPDGIVDGSTTGQDGGVITLPTASLFTRYDEPALIGLTVATNAATGVTSGTIKALCRYIYDPAE